jgi:hypothetical protein
MAAESANTVTHVLSYRKACQINDSNDAIMDIDFPGITSLERCPLHREQEA